MPELQRLRDLVKNGPMVVAPGAYDCITARTIEVAAFPAIYVSGSATAASQGYPDYGLLTMTEMVGNASKIAAVTRLPVIADADTGFGNELNVVRTVREYERAGVAAIHIEDQAFPKRCGHLDEKEIIAAEDYVSKIRAAAMSRQSPDFVIIARTDARAVTGLEDAIARANAALEAGADVAFVEAPQSVEEMRAIPRLVKGPCLVNVVWGGRTPVLPVTELETMGYAIAIFPSILSRMVIDACENVLQQMKTTGCHPSPSKDITLTDFFQRVGAEEWDHYRTAFREPASVNGSSGSHRTPGVLASDSTELEFESRSER